jgi:hypothetical protein
MNDLTTQAVKFVSIGICVFMCCRVTAQEEYLKMHDKDRRFVKSVRYCDGDDAEITFASKADVHGDGEYFNQRYYSGSDEITSIMVTKGESVCVKRDCDCGAKDQPLCFTFTPPERDIHLETTKATCNNSSNGTAHLAVTGYKNPVFRWSNGASGPDQNNLKAGDYTVTLTYGDDCSTVIPVTIGEPLPADTSGLQLDTKPALCHGTATGSATAIYPQKTNESSVLWDNGLSGFSNNALEAGPRQLYLTQDADHCSTVHFNIAEPNTTTVNYAVTSPRCKGESNGQIELKVYGGTPNYSLKFRDKDFKNIQINQSVQLLQIKAGSYDVTIIDSNNCHTTTTILVTEPDSVAGIFSLPPLVNGFHNPCYGEKSGYINTIPQGGNGGYTYQWKLQKKDSLISSAQNIKDLKRGTYTVIISDKDNCQSKLYKVKITEPKKILKYETDYTTLASATKKVEILGGVPPFTVKVSDRNNSKKTKMFHKIKKLALSTLAGTTKHLEITDANGCFASIDVQLNPKQPFILPPHGRGYWPCKEGAHGKARQHVHGNTVYGSFMKARNKDRRKR